MNSRRNSKLFLLLAVVGALAVVVAPFAVESRATAAEDGGGESATPFFRLPESPVAGGRLFMEKGCVMCHAIRGLGGAGGPDLGKVQAAWSFLDIAGVMWNHSPRMEAEFKRRKLARPQLESEEMFQLIAFVYFLNYFGDPGDAAKGELLFLRKDCIKCHTVGDHGAEDGHALDKFQFYRSPAFLSAALWNASKDMTLMMKEKAVHRPVYEASDVVDILAYIRREAHPQKEDGRVYLPPGNSRKGAALFKTKGCAECHAVQGAGGDVGPALGSWESGGVLSQMAGAIWNHSPDMLKTMEEAKIEFQKFTEEEMSDLMTYLYFSSFIDPPGNPPKGQELFKEKKCITCHEAEPGETPVGLEASEMKLLSASGVITAMWNHASEMDEASLSINIAWPQFRPGEMGDMVAYIKSLSDAAEETPAVPEPKSEGE